MAKKGFLDGYKTYDTSNGLGNSTKWKNSFTERMSFQDANTLLLNNKDTPHTILGVNENATLLEIKSAFRQLITEWHPDKNPHRQQEAQIQSKRIIAAYTVLKNLKTP